MNALPAEMNTHILGMLPGWEVSRFVRLNTKFAKLIKDNKARLARPSVEITVFKIPDRKNLPRKLDKFFITTERGEFWATMNQQGLIHELHETQGCLEFLHEFLFSQRQRGIFKNFKFTDFITWMLYKVDVSCLQLGKDHVEEFGTFMKYLGAALEQTGARLHKIYLNMHYNSDNMAIEKIFTAVCKQQLKSGVPTELNIRSKEQTSIIPLFENDKLDSYCNIFYDVVCEFEFTKIFPIMIGMSKKWLGGGSTKLHSQIHLTWNPDERITSKRHASELGLYEVQPVNMTMEEIAKICITPNESEEELTLSQVPSVDVNLELAAAILEEQVSVKKENNVEIHDEKAAQIPAEGDNFEAKQAEPADETNNAENKEASAPVKATAV